MNTDARFRRVPRHLEMELALNAELRQRKCSRCGHPSDWHRVDDADPTNYGSPETWKTRCIGYDCEAGGPPVSNGCDCPNFVAEEAPNVPQPQPESERLCHYCGQPMKPKEIKKLPDEYDHARGCPYSREKVDEPDAISHPQKKLVEEMCEAYNSRDLWDAQQVRMIAVLEAVKRHLLGQVTDKEWHNQGFKGNQSHWRETFNDLLASRRAGKGAV